MNAAARKQTTKHVRLNRDTIGVRITVKGVTLDVIRWGRELKVIGEVERVEPIKREIQTTPEWEV